MPERHVTTRDIAALAKVSPMTVSLALRAHPKIPVETRTRIVTLARSLGYRPDPKMAQLMSHLRLRRKPRFRSTICALHSGALARQSYQNIVIQSARRQAEALGYGFRLIDISASGPNPKALGRSLHYQGVEGVLFPPSIPTGDFRELMEWSCFSVVAATYGVLAPEFHRVVPHQFGNTLLLCRRLTELGYRRIGLVLRQSQDLRVHHGFSGAVTWQNAFGGTEQVTPLIHPGDVPTAVTPWFEREQPDVIIAGGPGDCDAIRHQLGARRCRGVGFAVTACLTRRQFSGIDEQPEVIGAAAIDLLHAKIVANEKGIPSHPTTTMVIGRFNPGRTTRPRAAS